MKNVKNINNTPVGIQIQKEFDTIVIEQVSIYDYLSYDPVPQQRDTVTRAKKKSTKKMLETLKAAHLDVALIEFQEDCEYYGVTYKKGTRLIVNGNTRKYYWANNLSDAIPKYVNATVFKVWTMDEVKDIYNTFDSPDATEKNQEKLYGIIHRIYNYEAVSSKVQKGELLTALQFAGFCLNPTEYPIEDRKIERIHYMVSDFIEEIKAFDVSCKNPSKWDQALVSAALMLFKVYGTDNDKLKEFLHRIDNRILDTTRSERDGATHICLEWMTNEKWKYKRTSFVKSTNNGKDGNLTQTVPFILYWAEKFMEDKKQSNLGGGWDTKATTWFDSYNKTNNGLINALGLEKEA